MKQQLYVGKKPTESTFRKIRNDFIKANGGLWTSTFFPNIGSDWVEWCRAEMPDWIKNRESWILSVKGDAKLLVIDNYSDLEKTYEDFPLVSGSGFQCLDFEKISKHYDGVHLTTEGQWATRFSYPLTLYGWDCECTHWFRWCFDDIEYFQLKEVNGF